MVASFKIRLQHLYRSTYQGTRLGFTFEEFVDEIEDFNNMLEAFEERNSEKAAEALENPMDRFVEKAKERIL